MMRWLNRLKHWHVFIVLFACPMVVSIVDVPGPTIEKSISNLVSFTLYTLWLWSVGYQANRSGLGLGGILLALCLLTMISSFAIATIFLIIDNKLFRDLFTILMFAFLPISAFLAGRLLNQAEGQGRNSWGWFSLGLLLIIYPIGLWIIQPRINRLTDSLE